MDRQPIPISSEDLRDSLGTAVVPMTVDVRETTAFSVPPATVRDTAVKIDAPPYDIVGALLALSQGRSAGFVKDHAMLEQGMVMHDAL